MSESEVLSADIDKLEQQVAGGEIPDHVAVIMDGNGRWATARGFPRVHGHRSAVKAVRDVVRTAGRLGISYLTLYTFSSENWRRPQYEVDALMDLLTKSLLSELEELMSNNVRLRAMGRIHNLPSSTLANLQQVITATADNKGLTLVLALNYGGRLELVDAVSRIVQRIQAGLADWESIDESTIDAHLYQPDLPPPDLVIRSGGEQRLSNFLLWQAAYAELYFSSVLWPDFRNREFLLAIQDFQRRQRRYGGLS